MAAAVLGAPISTTLIIFEITGDWQAGVAVMVSVSLASIVASRLVKMSFFLTQLARRGVDIADGPQTYIPRLQPIIGLTRARGADDGAPDTQCWDLVEQGAFLDRGATLAEALPALDAHRGPFLPVVETNVDGGRELIGALFHVDALKAYARALEDTAREEHS